MCVWFVVIVRVLKCSSFRVKLINLELGLEICYFES